MTSVSSASQIRNRTQLYLMKIPENTYIQKPQEIITLLFRMLSMEYGIIPKKERIEKGSVNISKYVAKEFLSYLSKHFQLNEEFYLSFTTNLFDFETEKNSLLLKYFSLLFLAETLFQFPNLLENVNLFIERAAICEE